MDFKLDMNTIKWMAAGLLSAAAANAAASDGDGPGAGLMLLLYAQAVLVAMVLPAGFILFRRGLALGDKLKWLAGLVALDIGACVLLYLAFEAGSIGDGLLNPLVWIALLIPGYILAYYYHLAVQRYPSSTDTPS